MQCEQSAIAGRNNQPNSGWTIFVSRFVVGLGVMGNNKPSFGRHSRICSVCNHTRYGKTETDFVAWGSPAATTQEYSLSDISGIYGHAPTPPAIQQAAAQRPGRGARADNREILGSRGHTSAVAAVQRSTLWGELIDRSLPGNLAYPPASNRMSGSPPCSSIPKGGIP
jgi:hypothetical protein